MANESEFEPSLSDVERLCAAIDQQQREGEIQQRSMEDLRKALATLNHAVENLHTRLVTRAYKTSPMAANSARQMVEKTEPDGSN